MTDDMREIVLGVLAAGITAMLGWFARTYLLRRRLRRKQRFLGLPALSECALVVNRDADGSDWSVARHDVYALLELAGLVRECGAKPDVVAHDGMQQGFGERTEFCVGGPLSNERTEAHLQSLLPGVAVGTTLDPVGDRFAFTIGGERYRMEAGGTEYVLLARLTAGQEEHARPVFLFCGQRAVTNQAAARYLARHHVRLARRFGRKGTFCLLLKVVNSRAYGADVVELVGDVTRAATTAVPQPRSEPDPEREGQSSDSSA